MTKTRDLADLGGGFIQSGTGAVQRTVESKLQDVVSVLDFIPLSEHAAIKAGTSTYDCTSDYTALINATAEGSTVYWSPGTYTGSFSSTKAFKLVGGPNVTLKYTTGYAISFSGSIGSASSFTNPSLHDTTLTGTSGLVAGDIVRIYSGNVRPSDSQPVNYEIVKMVSASDIEDKIKSTQTGGSPVYAKLTTLKNVEVEGFVIDDTGTNGGGVKLLYCEDAYVSKIKMYGGKSSTVFADSCYGVKVHDSYRFAPFDTTSGQGYHIQYYSCRFVEAVNIHGTKCRHVLDSDSVYRLTAKNIVCTQGISSDVAITHNGFGGSHLYDNLTISEGVSYGISTASQGIEVGDEDEQVLRDVTITNSSISNKDLTDRGSGSPAVYFQYPCADLYVNNCSITAETTDAGTNYIAVRVDGPPKGRVVFSNVYVKNYTVGFYLYSPNPNVYGAATEDPILISDFKFDTVKKPVWDFYYSDIEVYIVIENPYGVADSDLYYDTFLKTQYAHSGDTTLNLNQLLISTNTLGIHDHPDGYTSYVNFGRQGKIDSSFSGSTVSQSSAMIIGNGGRFITGQAITSIAKPIGIGGSFVFYGLTTASTFTDANLLGSPITVDPGERIEFVPLDGYRWRALLSTFTLS